MRARACTGRWGPAAAQSRRAGRRIWSVQPVETVPLWSWEEEESFTLEIRIEGDRLL